MADLLYLSYKLHNPSAQLILRSFEKLLRAFPYSKLTRATSTLQIIAVEPGEPAIYEESYEAPFDPEDALTPVREWAAADVSVSLEAWWDLWQYDKEEWKLLPARVTLMAFSPKFESGHDDAIRVDFGIDTHFLPQPELPNFLLMSKSNLRSLLHLVHELDATFPAAVRSLWTESGENFAVRLQQALPGVGSTME